MADYEIYLSSAAGERVAGPLMGLQSLEWSIGLGLVGVVKANFGLEDFDPLWLDSSLRLELGRNAPAGQAALVQAFFLMDYGEQMITQPGGDIEFAWLRGYDLNHILTRRIVAAAAGSAEALKTGYACDVMAEYAEEALLTDANRDISDEFDLTIVYIAGMGAEISYAASRGQLLSVLQGCANNSSARGTPVRFWIEPISASSGRLRIAEYPWGADRRNEAAFSPEAGTLYNAAWEYRSGESANFAYVGGQGEGENRMVGEVQTGGASPMFRREIWLENTQIVTLESLEAWGLAQLWKFRPRYLFSATLRDTELSTFGRDWALGDVVKAEYRGRSWDAEILAVAGKYDEAGDQIWAICATEAVEIE